MRKRPLGAVIRMYYVGDDGGRGTRLPETSDYVPRALFRRELVGSDSRCAKARDRIF